MKSPFKFLDSYTKDDRAIFFGRDREIEELYHRVFESKIMLVYGVSGTGKSSLIHCGLANKFQDTDWLPLVSPTLPAVTGQLNSFHSDSATASRNPRSPAGAEYPAMNRPNCAGSAAISASRRRYTASTAAMRAGLPPPSMRTCEPPCAMAEPRSAISSSAPVGRAMRSPNLVPKVLM